jgi:molybdopterin-guanine dinucleotide biosynthesis protein A
LRIFGVILAGGEGRRMAGADKALVPLAGRPLIAHVLDRLEPQVERVLISANGDAARFAGFGCPVVADAAPQGPLSGVLSALTVAAGMGATHVVSTPVDTPFLPGDLVPQLLLAAEGSPAGLPWRRTRPAIILPPRFGRWGWPRPWPPSLRRARPRSRASPMPITPPARASPTPAPS